MKRRGFLGITIGSLAGCLNEVDESSIKSPSRSKTTSSSTRTPTRTKDVVELFLSWKYSERKKDIAEIAFRMPPVNLALGDFDFVQLDGTFYEPEITLIPAKAKYVFVGERAETVEENATVIKYESLSDLEQNETDKSISREEYVVTTNGTFPRGFEYVSEAGSVYVERDGDYYNIAVKRHGDAPAHKEVRLTPVSPNRVRQDDSIIDVIELSPDARAAVSGAITDGSYMASGQAPADVRTINGYDLAVVAEMYYKPTLTESDDAYTFKLSHIGKGRQYARAHCRGSGRRPPIPGL